MINDNGQLPFEGDTFIPQEILKLKERFNISNVLETGSQYGSTLKWFTGHFDSAIGCEPNETFFNIAKGKGVIIYRELSVDFLPKFSEAKNVLIFIDSHWHNTPCPLKNELKIISKFTFEPVICIHDFKVPNKDFGYDAYDYVLEFSEIESLLKKIYKKGFDYHYNTETNGANRGIIYIYPKQ